MNHVVTRYLKREPGDRLYKLELEFLAMQWLRDMATGKQKTIEEPGKALALAGFKESIKDASISLGEEP